MLLNLLTYKFLSSEPDPEAKLDKDMKSVAEEDALRKLLTSDEDEDEENKSDESDKDEDEKKKKDKSKEENKEKKKPKSKNKDTKKGKSYNIPSFMLINKYIYESRFIE